MDLELAGRKVLVTGGTKGIGLACASSFLAEGCDVMIVGSTAGSLAAAIGELGARPTLRGRVADLSRQADIDALAPVLDEVDILVNNAGAIPGGGFESVSAQQWRAAWDLKVFGYVETTRRSVAAMQARGSGVILNVIGIYGAFPAYDYLCGSAGNAALMAITEALGAQASRSGVRVLGVNPGPTQTARLEKLYRSRALSRFGTEERWTELLCDLPFNRLAQPEEIADLVTFLASARASYLSGIVVNAHGGFI